MKAAPIPHNASARLHKITEDKTSTGHLRLSCICGANAVKQPYMKPADWLVTVREFRERHK